METYKISEDDLREAVKSATKKLMRNQPKWAKDPSLFTLEYSIEHGIKEELYKRHEGKFEFL
jgi:hypothetical protein